MTTDVPRMQLPLPSDLTHHEALICMWLGSDPPLLAIARTRAAGDEFNWGDDDLAAWVSDLVYDAQYRVEGGIPDLAWVDVDGGNVEAARVLRTSVSERAMDAIDEDGWARIRTALLAGWEG